MRLMGRLLASFLFCATVLSAGCALRSRSVVGTWDIQGGPGPATMTFQADGNCRTEAHLPGRSSMVFGPYKQLGDRVTFDMSVNSHRTATIHWKSDDEMVMMGDDGVAMTLTRRK